MGGGISGGGWACARPTSCKGVGQEHSGFRWLTACMRLCAPPPRRRQHPNDSGRMPGRRHDADLRDGPAAAENLREVERYY